MNTLFSGQTRSRPSINLSGAQSQSVAQAASSSSSHTDNSSIASKARSERQARESQRRLDRAARVIQRLYRSNRLAGDIRGEIRKELDATLDALSKGNVNTSRDLLDATTRLAFVFRENNRTDVARLGRWARLVAVGKPRVKLFQGFCDVQGDKNLYARWTHALCVLSGRIGRMAAISPSLPSVPLFLELVKQLLDPAKYKDLPSHVQDYPSQLAASLVRNETMRDLRQHILSFQPNTRPLPPSLSPTITIALSLLSRTVSNPTLNFTAIQQFLLSILTIPQLASTTAPRLPNPALQSLTGEKAAVPYFEILCTVVADEDALASLGGTQTAHLLSNLVSTGKGRLEKGEFKNGKLLGVLLDVYRLCLERIPSSLLVARDGALDLKGKSRETAIDLNIEEDGDVVMSNTPARPSSATSSSLDHSTYSTLLSLTHDPFLSAIIRTSTHFSSTTRPSLFSFLVSLLYSFLPSSSVKSEIVNTLVYSSQAGGSSRGLLREIWRGWIRSSPLARALAQGSTTGSVTTSVINALSNQGFKQDWTAFILLAEMYARCLLTLGDDEFYAHSSSNTEGAMSRNPLSTDEVIGLSTLWRNVAFALYWQPEVLGTPGGQGRTVVGTRVPLEGLRKLATGLLQSLHTRDSRRQFTPPNHWIMTSQMDLQSFIESAIVEDQKLEEEEADQPAPLSRGRTHGRNNIDSDEEMDEDELPRPHITARRHLPPSRRQMAFVSPRLGVLNNIPFVIPFDVRVSIFQQFIANDRVRLHQIQHPSVRNRFSVGSDGRRIAAAATIRRGHVADDGFATLNGLGSMLKERLAIRFLDQYGQEEAGIDGGGLFKEFLTELSKEAFDVDRGLWLETSSHELYPASTSYSRENFSLQWYAFLGRIMGKALYEGILVDVRFAPFFLSKWLGRASGFDDLASFEPELYHGLVQLKNYTGDVEKDLSLNFTVTDDDFGVSRTIELIPNGSNTPVTNENRISYIYRVSDYRLNKQISAQCSAFFSGLSDLIDPKWLRMFNTVELGLLVGGAETSIDIDDLRHNTVYSRGFDESHETVQYFWKVVNEFDQEDKKALVKFCTSCPRPPLLGFGQLNPKFALGNGGADEDRMPSTSTCVNLLKLPTYSSPERLKQKLLASIHSGAGFDLS